MAQVDFFLKLDGIKGEATDAKHKGEIEVESWSWGETNSGSMGMGAGGGSGKVMMQDVHIVKKYDSASPVLFISCATGKHIKEGTLTCRKAGGEQQEYLTIKLTDLLVSSYQSGGAGAGGVIPVDQLSLNFSKIEMEYKPQKADGTLDAPVKQGYDVKANKKI
jgi:type VI secretion system secreted protein Hcp